MKVEGGKRGELLSYFTTIGMQRSTIDNVAVGITYWVQVRTVTLKVKDQVYVKNNCCAFQVGCKWHHSSSNHCREGKRFDREVAADKMRYSKFGSIDLISRTSLIRLDDLLVPDDRQNTPQHRGGPGKRFGIFSQLSPPLLAQDSIR